MTAPTPDDLPRELLAAYADGELDGPSRDRVECWLADHPEGLGEVQSQRSFSPANAGLWDRARPPEPSEQEWARARNGLRATRLAALSAASPERPCGAARCLGIGGVGRGRGRRGGRVDPRSGRAFPAIPRTNRMVEMKRGDEYAPHPRMVISLPCCAPSTHRRLRDAPDRDRRRRGPRTRARVPGRYAPGGPAPAGRHDGAGDGGRTVACGSRTERHVAHRQPEDDDFAQRCPHDLRGQLR